MFLSKRFIIIFAFSPRTGHGRAEPRPGQGVPGVLRAQRAPRKLGRVHRLVRETDGLGNQPEHAHLRVVSGRPPAQHGHHAADAHHQRVRCAVAAPGGHGDTQLEAGPDQVVVDEGEWSYNNDINNTLSNQSGRSVPAVVLVGL